MFKLSSTSDRTQGVIVIGALIIGFIITGTWLD